MHTDQIDTKEFFSWKGLTIYHAEDVLKVGTDAVLLGSWIPEVISSANTIFDAGTGTGILSMICATYFPYARICAIDIDEKAVALAQFNARHAGFEEMITVIKSDLLDPGSAPHQPYDLIVCNPPFYNTKVLPQEAFNVRSKHSSVPAAEWMKPLACRLRKDGHLCMIVPAEEAHAWISAANESGLYNHHRINVFSYDSDLTAKRSLLHFTNTLIKPDIRKLVIYAGDKTYTDKYLSMTGITSTNNSER